MKRLKKLSVKSKNRLIAALAIFLVIGLSMLLFWQFPDFFFPWYRYFSKAVIKAFSTVSSCLPVAAWDILELCLILIGVGGFIYTIVKKKPVMDYLSLVILIVAVLVFIDVDFWDLNHYGPSLAEELDLQATGFTKEEMKEAASWYFNKAAEYAEIVERDENEKLIGMDEKELQKISGEAYLSLENVAEIFRNGSTDPVKKVSVFNTYLLYKGVIGMFVPMTGEATYTTKTTVIDQPFTMCHEAGHRLGIASEEDANFASYLACEASENLYIQYSGYYSAFVYLYNAIVGEDQQALSEMIDINQESYRLLCQDANAVSDYYAAYEGPVQEVADKVNDTYIKVFADKDGIKSYGRVVNDLIAWYQKNYKNASK